MNWTDALHSWVGKGLNQSSARKTRHSNRAGGARTDQHQIGIKQSVNRDARIKKAISEPQLHEHQDPGETDAGKSNEQPDRLAGQQQPGQRNPSPLPEVSHGSNLAITFNPASRSTRRASASSRATRTSTTRASASPVGSVDNTSRC